MPSSLVWGSTTLPKPQRSNTGEAGTTPIGSIAYGPDNTLYSTEIGFRDHWTYSWHGLSESERGDIEAAYYANAFHATSLTLLTGTTVTVTAAHQPLVFAISYDINHNPIYATTISFRRSTITEPGN